jgi:hypothetical protein
MKRLLLVLFLALPIVLPTPAVGAMGEAGGMTDLGGMPPETRPGTTKATSMWKGVCPSTSAFQGRSSWT